MMDYIQEAERKWGITLQKNVRGEWHGPCPFCGGGTDRFHVWTEKGNYWCRQCDAKGFVIDAADLTPEERQRLQLEQRFTAIERKQREQERRLTALEKMARCEDWRFFHEALTEQRREYWFREGIFDGAIAHYRLGYCNACPTDYEHRPSYTIPVWQNGVLRNIRHRLVGADNGDKYRPHMAGLGSQLFNADSLLHNRGVPAVIWEGEKKTIVMSQHLEGVAHTGTMGKGVFEGEWIPWYQGASEVIIALDPDAIERGCALGKGLRRRGLENVRVAHFPVKPDDAINLYDASLEDIQYILNTARRV